HIEFELHEMARLARIIGLDSHRFRMRAGRFAGFDFDADCANLTRLEDFREVHSRAASAWRDRFDIQDGAAAVPDAYGPHQRLVLWLLAEIEVFFLRDHDQF